MKTKKTSRTAQGAGTTAENRKSDILKTVSNFSLYIAKSINMPRNYRHSGELHIGAIEDGVFNPNSEDIYLVAQIKDNIFRAAIGDKTMYCILLSDEQANRSGRRVVRAEDYEMAAKLRDAKNVFIYMNNLNDLLDSFGLRLEDCEFLFTVRVSQDSNSGYSNFDLTGDTEMRIDSYELGSLLTKALKLAGKGDSDLVEALSTNLTSLNKLSNNVLAYLLFIKGVAKDSKGDKQAANELFAEAIRLDPAIEQFIKEHRLTKDDQSGNSTNQDKNK